jgi:dihydroorotase-like cyclic amidohydrolase
MIDLIIRGGEVVTPQGVGNWTVGVKDGRIATIGVDDRSIEAARVIDATVKSSFPAASSRMLISRAW